MKIPRPAPKTTMPADATKVFSGVIFDIYQWQQKMFDGSFKTFEKSKRPDTVSVLAVTKEQKIVLIKEEQPNMKPTWSLPEGRIDSPDADVTTEALRELQEETGYVPTEVELWLSKQVSEKIDWAIYTFIVRGCTKTTEVPFDIGERSVIKLVSFEEFIEIVSDPDFRDSEITMEILRARLEPQSLLKLKQRIFGIIV